MATASMGEFKGDFVLYDHDQPEIEIMEPSRVQRHVQDMSTFLERSEEILYGEQSIRFPKPLEAPAIHDQSEPLPDITDFSAALVSGTEWPSEMEDFPMDDFPMDDTTTLHDIHDRLDKFKIRSPDSTFGEMNSRRNSSQWNDDPSIADRRYSTDTDAYSYRSCVSPISMKEKMPIINCNDSGVYSTSFESTGRQSVVKQSPFMGHVDSPDDPYSATDWPGIAFPQNSFQPSSTEPEIISSPSPDYDIRYLFPDLLDDGLLPQPTSQASSSWQTTPFTSTKQTLSNAGREAITRDILIPLTKTRSLSAFHKLFRQAQEGMVDGSIACLRDLEKDLFQHGHDSDNCTGPLFLRLFHEFFEYCRKALPGVPDEDQCRPTDTEQYCASYYLDAWHRIFGHVQTIWKLKPDQSERIVKEMQLDPTGGRLKSCPKRGKALPPYSSLKRSMPGPGPPLGYSYTNKKRSQRSACSTSEQTLDQVSAIGSASTLITPRSMTTTMGIHPNSAYALDELSINAPPGSNDNHVQQIYMTSPQNIPFHYDIETRTAQTEIHLGRHAQEVRYSGVAEIPSGGVGIAGPPLSPVSLSTDWNNNQSLSPVTAYDNQGDDQSSNLGQRTNSNVHVCNVCQKTCSRLCDLTKHRKTHERPYKCQEKTCDYASRGFSAEKDRDRHYHDKHDVNQKRHHCHYGCEYSSTRLSNVKQHMEKTHDYDYRRSKSVNKRTVKKSQTQQPKNVLGVKRSPNRVTKKSPPILSPRDRAIASFQNTPATLPSNSPLLGLELLSPHTIQTSPIAMFNRLPSPPPPPQVIAPEVIQSHTPASIFEPEPIPSSFNDPMEAITAINRQKYFPEPISIVTAFNPNAVNNSLHDEYTPSPDEEFKRAFANDFLRDAPENLANQGYPLIHQPFDDEFDKRVAAGETVQLRP
ncbi:hypothetical protein EDC01DRAFT_45860 [Geopyxis carbonaria]|nr:hypothetical protein EDC01DRAFT_45860 [Geopyxis carbonaria]